MKIGYDVTSLVGLCTGVGNYTRHLLIHMLALGGDHGFLLLSNRAEATVDFPDSARVRPMIQPFPSRMLWMQSVLPRLLRELQLDVCHYPNSIGPLASPCRYVVTIHDMTLSFLPQFHPWRKRMIVRPLIPLVARRAERIITVSEHARDDIVRLLRVPRTQVVVIPEAAAPMFQVTSPVAQAQVRARYNLRGPYLLYVGTLEPRKNLARLIRAWHRLRRSGAIPHQLVLVGGRGWQDGELRRAIRSVDCGDALRVLGYVPTSDLPALYSAADAFAFPSLAEGFGLPVIEAMACGTPALISTALALRELAGDAALAVEPCDERAIADALDQLLNDAALRDDLRARGLQRAATFTWEAAARRTLAVYQAAVA
jgi:glycosyltransferase involved in cell wall biosynthesis